MSAFNYQRGGSWRNNKFPDWLNDQWQVVMLNMYMEDLAENNIECIYDVVSNLRPLIENSYAQVSKDGWTIILEILERVVSMISSNNLSSAYSKESAKEAFKCLEYIYNTSLYKIPLTDIGNLITIIDYFAALKDDLNTSLIAVNLLHSVADYMAQQVKEKNELWTLLFSKFKRIGADERRELRSAGFKTLEQIMVNHGKILPSTTWYYALIDIPIQFLEFLKVNYLSRIRNKEELHSGGENIEDVDLEAEEENAWEESITMFYSSFIRILTTFHSYEEGTLM